MNRFLTGFVFTLLIGLAANAVAKVNIVATLADYAAVAREVGGDLVDITTMAKPTEDPHFADAKPSFIVKLRAADVLIEGGAELEAGWLPPLLRTAGNAKLASGAPGRVLASEGIRLLGIPDNLSRAAGDVHASGNPHFMVDPIIAKAVAAHIARALAVADPANAATYQANYGKFETTINAKLQEWGKAMLPFKGVHVAAYHDDWLYLANRFGLSIDVFLEPKPGVPPSPSYLVEVIARVKANHIKAILVEPYHNRKTAEKVASSTGATVVDTCQYPGGLPDTATYVKMMDLLIGRISAALKN